MRFKNRSVYQRVFYLIVKRFISYDKLEWTWKDVAMNLLKVGVLASKHSSGQNSDIYSEQLFSESDSESCGFLVCI
jgi:hypothetical protein